MRTDIVDLSSLFFTIGAQLCLLLCPYARSFLTCVLVLCPSARSYIAFVLYFAPRPGPTYPYLITLSLGQVLHYSPTTLSMGQVPHDLRPTTLSPGQVLHNLRVICPQVRSYLTCVICLVSRTTTYISLTLSPSFHLPVSPYFNFLYIQVWSYSFLYIYIYNLSRDTNSLPGTPLHLQRIQAIPGYFFPAWYLFNSWSRNTIIIYIALFNLSFNLKNTLLIRFLSLLKVQIKYNTRCTYTEGFESPRYTPQVICMLYDIIIVRL